MVEYVLGKREIISIGDEGTFGTFANPTWILKNAKVTPSDDEDWQEILGAGSDTIYPTKQVGNKIRGFNLSFNPQDWRMLPFVLGASTVGGTYTHTMTGIASTIGSFSLQRIRSHSTQTGLVAKYEGCKVKTCTINWNTTGTNKFIEINLDCVAEDVTNADAGAGSPTAASTDLFQAKHVQLSLNSGNIVYLLGGSLVIEENLNDSMFADFSASGVIAEPQPTVRRVKGTFTVNYTDKSWIDFQYNRVVVPGTNTLSFIRNNTNDKLVLTFNNLRLKCPDPTVIDGPNIVQVEFDADYVGAVATDSISSYPDES